jgi:hypothetical protein
VAEIGQLFIQLGDLLDCECDWLPGQFHV